MFISCFSAEIACLTAAAILMAPSVRALDEPVAPAQLVRQSTAGLVGLSEDEGRPVGVGADYKIGFEPGGAEFVPALGAAAPHNHSLRLQFLSASRGETLLLAADGSARAELDAADPDGRSVRYQHAAGLSERWEVRPEGAEQSFVLDEVPAGRGDLVVRLQLTTEMSVQDHADAGDALTLLAAAPDGTTLGGVRVGAVRGVDALGRSTPGAARLVGDVLELSLPDAFLQAARGPVVLDPLVGPVHTFGTSSLNQHTARAAADSSSRYLLVWVRDYSATDHDIYGVRVAVDGGVLGGLINVELSTQNDIYADVAWVRLSGRFLVVWRREGWPGGGYFGRTVNPADGSLGPTGIVAPSSSTISGWIPMLGGNSTLVDDRCLLVWSHFDSSVALGSEMRVASVHVPSSGLPFADPSVKFQSAAALTFVGMDLANTGGATNHFLFVWTNSVAGLRGRVFDRFGNTIVGTVTLAADATNYLTVDPEVDGDGNRWAVAYRNQPGELHCLRVQLGTGTIPSLNLGPNLTLYPDKWWRPSVVWNGLSFQVATVYGGLPLGTPEAPFDIGGIAPVSFAVSDPFVDVGTTKNDADGVRLVSPWAGSGIAAETGLAYWIEWPLLPPTDTSVVWQTVTSHGPGGSVVDLGGGCGTGGGSLLATGVPALANPAFGFVVLGAYLTAPVIYFNFNFAGLGVPCGSCTFVPLNIYFAVPAFAGVAFMPTPLEAEPFWDGFMFEAQAIVFTPGPSPCPSLPGVSFSNRLLVTLH